MGLIENSLERPDQNQAKALIVHDRASLKKCLDFIQEELETVSQNLFAELICRQEQLQFEHRVILGYF